MSGGNGSVTLGDATLSSEQAYGLIGGATFTAAAVTSMSNSHATGVYGAVTGLLNVDPPIKSVAATATVGAYTLPGASAVYGADRTLGTFGNGVG